MSRTLWVSRVIQSEWWRGERSRTSGSFGWGWSSFSDFVGWYCGICDEARVLKETAFEAGEIETLQGQESCLDRLTHVSMLSWKTYGRGISTTWRKITLKLSESLQTFTAVDCSFWHACRQGEPDVLKISLLRPELFLESAHILGKHDTRWDGSLKRPSTPSRTPICR